MNDSMVDTRVETVPALKVVREQTVELALKVLMTMPPVREELVNELQARVKSGAYEVSSETIASDIVGHLLAKDD